MIELSDVRGDCHLHSVDSDGRNTIEEMAKAAVELDYEYIVITDHSKRVTFAGLDEKQLARQWSQIDALNAKSDTVRVLKGVEVDILSDGTLDLDDECLARAEVVVASVHYDRDMNRDTMTERIVTAMRNPHVNILDHPTGRLLLRRRPYPVDFERIVKAARKNGVMLECNAAPHRLDLKDSHLREAKAKGVPVVISTDAHRMRRLENMGFGVDTARRGWLTAADVANTRGLCDFLALLQR